MTRKMMLSIADNNSSIPVSVSDSVINYHNDWGHFIDIEKTSANSYGRQRIYSCPVYREGILDVIYESPEPVAPEMNDNELSDLNISVVKKNTLDKKSIRYKVSYIASICIVIGTFGFSLYNIFVL